MEKSKDYYLHRRLLLFTALVYPVFGYINCYVLQPAIENELSVYSRIAFSTIVAITMLVSTKLTSLQTNSYKVIVFFMYLGLSHLLIIGYFNSFEFNHSIGVVMTIVGTTIVLKTKKELVYYLGYIAILSTALILLSEPSHISKATNLMVFISTTLVSYILMSFKISAEEKTLAANKKLEELRVISSIQNSELLLLASLIEETHDAIQACNEEGDFVFMNKVGRERLGLSENDVKNLTIFKLESIFKTKEDWYQHVKETKESNGIIIESTNTDILTGRVFPVEVRIRNAEIDGKRYQIAVSKDISQQKANELELIEKERQLNSIFSSMTEGIVLQDEVGMILKCNEAAEKILGLTYDQMIGKKSVDPDWRAVHEDGSDFPGETNPSMESLRTGKPFFKVIMGVHKPNNELTWISINSMPLFEQGQEKPNAVVCTFQNITQERELQNRVNRNISLLNEAQQLAKIGNYEKDFVGENSMWSDYMYEIFQQPKNINVRDFNFLDFVHPDQKEWTSAYYREHFMKGEPFISKIKTILPNGQEATLNINVISKQNSEGKIISIKGTVQDITKIEKLNEQNEMLSKLIEQTPETIQVFDIKGNFIYANKAALKDLQISQEELAGKKIHDFVTAYQENEGLWESGIEELRIKNQIYRERIITGKDGKQTQIAVTASLVSNSGKDLLITFSRDVTEAKKQQSLINQAIKDKEIAEKSAKIKEEFLANMSHEIRTPMNGVVGMIDLLEKTTSPTPLQVEYLHTIRNSSKTLLNIINDILDLSKLEAGKMELRKEKTEIMTVVNDMVDLYQAKASEKKIDLLGKFGKGIPSTIKTDGTRLKQVLSNLLSNAIKFTDAGSVTITSEILQREGNKATLKFSVTDSGIGMNKEDLKLLFSSFKQLDSSSSKMHEGTGLGLAISKNIVGLFEGEINVESEIGKGTTFWFTMQTEIMEDEVNNYASLTNTEVVSNEPIPMNILLVDDKQVNLIVARTMLMSFGCKVTSAKDGFEAIEKYKSDVFDLVLMDIQMPKLDGVQSTKQIKEQHKNTCPIVALTANAMEGDREKYLAEGFDDYLAKPIELSTLRAVLLKWKNKKS